MTKIIGFTDPGGRAGENQDSIGWDEAQGLALVADGLGGHAGGQVASRIVKDTVLALTKTLGLCAAALRAHAVMVDAAGKSEQLNGMASTLVAVQIAKRKANVIWVGDSRAYLWREKLLSRLTRDHSVVEELRSIADLSDTQVFTHPLRNEVTNVLGAGDPVPSSNEIQLHKGDWILLCSDGLSGELRNHEIASVLAVTESVSEAAQALIAAVLKIGGHDNVSAVLVEYDGRASRNSPSRLGDGATAWLAALAGVVLAALVAGALFWFRSKR